MRTTPWRALTELPRYLKALDRRLAKHPDNPERDAKHAATLAGWWQRLHERHERNRAAGRQEPALEDFRWLLEELAVSLFAQELGTAVPVSPKRLDEQLEKIRREADSF